MPRPRPAPELDIRDYIWFGIFIPFPLLSLWFTTLDGVPSIGDFNPDTVQGLMAIIVQFALVAVSLPWFKWTRQEMATMYTFAFFVLWGLSKVFVGRLNSKWNIEQAPCANQTALAGFRMWNPEFHFHPLAFFLLFVPMLLAHYFLMRIRMQKPISQYSWEDFQSVGRIVTWGLFAAGACAPLVQQGFMLNKGALSPATSCAHHPLWNFLGIKPAKVPDGYPSFPTACGALLCTKRKIPNDPEGRSKVDPVFNVDVPVHGMSKDKEVRRVLKFIGVKPGDMLEPFPYNSTDPESDTGTLMPSLLWMKIGYVKAVLIESPIIETIESAKDFNLWMVIRGIILSCLARFIGMTEPEGSTKKNAFLCLTLVTIGMTYMFGTDFVKDSVSSVAGTAGGVATQAISMAWVVVKNIHLYLQPLLHNVYQNKYVKKVCDYLTFGSVWIILYYLATRIFLDLYIDNDFWFFFRVLLGMGRLSFFAGPALIVAYWELGKVHVLPCVLLTIIHEVLIGWYAGPAFAEPLIALLFCSWVMLLADLYETKYPKGEDYCRRLRAM